MDQPARARDLFQKHETVITIVLAMLLQFTAIDRLIPDNADAPDYVTRIAATATLCLGILGEIWMTRRIGFWVLRAASERHWGDLKRSLIIWALGMACLIAFDLTMARSYNVGGFPVSLLMGMWLLAYVVSAGAARRTN